MATSRKPRKAYRPKPRTLPLTIRHNAEGDTDLQLIPRLDLEALREGRADESQWHGLTARLNLGMVLANSHHPQAAIDVMRSSLDAMRAISTRHARTGKWGAAGDELRAIGQGLDVTDDMQMIATRRELREALRTVHQFGTEEGMQCQ